MKRKWLSTLTSPATQITVVLGIKTRRPGVRIDKNQ
jgi:hypothetical protein